MSERLGPVPTRKHPKLETPPNHREPVGLMYSPATKTYNIPRKTEGVYSWLCLYPDFGDGCSFCDGPHKRDDCPDRLNNIEMLRLGLEPRELCAYNLCGNKISHHTIRCISIAMVCRRCYRRGHNGKKAHCALDENMLRHWYESAARLNKVCSNSEFKFFFPKDQPLWVNNRPELDTDLRRNMPKAHESAEEVERFRIKMKSVQHKSLFERQRAARKFAIRESTMVRLLEDWKLKPILDDRSK